MVFVFDFDGTITKKYAGNVEVPSVLSILRSEGVLNEEYSKEAYALKEKYHPIEIDPLVPQDTKYQKMNEWWEKHIQLLTQHSLRKEDVWKAANHPKLMLRDGVTGIFTFAKQNDIPIIIFSASGIGTDSIFFFLEKHGLANENLFIVSNKLEYKDGVITGVSHPLIHALNKNESTLKYFPDTQKALLGRKSVLLFGDSPHDADMVEDKNHELVVRIGLCNDKDPEKKKLALPLFQKKFDIVIENDSDLESIQRNLISTN